MARPLCPSAERQSDFHQACAFSKGRVDTSRGHATSISSPTLGVDSTATIHDDIPATTTKQGDSKPTVAPAISGKSGVQQTRSPQHPISPKPIPAPSGTLLQEARSRSGSFQNLLGARSGTRSSATRSGAPRSSNRSRHNPLWHNRLWNLLPSPLGIPLSNLLRNLHRNQTPPQPAPQPAGTRLAPRPKHRRKENKPIYLQNRTLDHEKTTTKNLTTSWMGCLSTHSLLGAGVEARSGSTSKPEKTCPKQQMNYAGHSFAIRMVHAVLPKIFYHQNQAGVLSIFKAFAEDARLCAEQGQVDSRGVRRFLVVLGCKGDLPFLHKAGQLRRSFYNLPKRPGALCRGICHLCQAGQANVQFEDVSEGARHNMTVGVETPWVEPPSFCYAIFMTNWLLKPSFNLIPGTCSILGKEGRLLPRP